MKLIAERPSPIASNDLVACEIVKGKDFGCVWHRHTECEITLVKSGGTERWVGNVLTPLKQGDLVFMGSDVPHDYRNRPASGERRCELEAVVVQFMPNLLGENWLQVPSIDLVRQLFERAQLGLEIHGESKLRAVRKLDQIIQTSGLRRVAILLNLLEDLAESDDLVEIASPGF